MAKAYIPKDIFGNPIPEDALLDEIRSRHEGRPPPQSETQRLVSELDLSSEDPELLPEKERHESRRKSFEEKTKKLFDDGRKREGRFNQEIDAGITNAIVGSKQFKNNPDALEVAENIAMDVIPHAASALATVTDPIYEDRYKYWKREVKLKKYQLLKDLQDKFDLSPETSEAVSMAVLGLVPLIYNGELEIDRQQFNLGPVTVRGAGKLHFAYENPEDARAQYDIEASTQDIAGLGVDADARIRGTNLEFGYDAEATARDVAGSGVDIAGGFGGDTTEIRRANIGASYRDAENRFLASIEASGDPTRLEYGRAKAELEARDLLGAGERINVGVTGYPLREHPSARFDIDAGVPLGRGRISGQARGNIEQGPTDVGFDYFLPVGETGRLIAGASTDPRDPYGKLAANVRYKANWDKGGIVDLQTNETASEVLAQSNTKTPDFMAPVLSSDPQPFREGGIASLPNNPVLAGQQHMLAYITPEEASRLRAQGGGVTPTGGQYRGPGGIASFQVAGLAGIGQTGGVHGGGGEGVGHGQGVAAAQAAAQANAQAEATATATANAQKSIIAIQPVNDLHARRNKFHPRSKAYADLTAQISDAMSVAVDNGYSDGAISKMNQVANMNVPDTFGNVTLALTLGDQEFSAFDIANMSDAEFSALSANPATGVKGDPESPLGMAVLGLGTTGLGMLSPALSLPTTAINVAYGLANPDDPSLGFMGLVEQGYKGLFGETPGETAGDVSEAIGLGKTPFADVTGYIGDAAGTVAESLGLSDAFGTPTPSTATTPNVPGGPGFPVMQIPSVEIGLQVPPTAAEVLTGPLPHYTAEQLAAQTGVTVAQAQQYLSGLPT